MTVKIDTVYQKRRVRSFVDREALVPVKVREIFNRLLKQVNLSAVDVHTATERFADRCTYSGDNYALISVPDTPALEKAHAQISVREDCVTFEVQGMTDAGFYTDIVYLTKPYDFSWDTA